MLTILIFWFWKDAFSKILALGTRPSYAYWITHRWFFEGTVLAQVPLQGHCLYSSVGPVLPQPLSVCDSLVSWLWICVLIVLVYRGSAQAAPGTLASEIKLGPGKATIYVCYAVITWALIGILAGLPLTIFLLW